MGARKNITSDFANEVIEFYKAGNTTALVRKKFKISAETVSKILRDYSVARNRRKSKYQNPTFTVNGAITVVLIKDTQDKFHEVIIDTDELSLVTNDIYRWRAIPQCVNKWRIADLTKDFIYLHRIIVNAKENDYVDHINGNPLDNRKQNLRIVTNQENCTNINDLCRNNTSGATGVSWDKSMKKWEAYVGLNYKKIHLGYFSDYDMAVRVSKEAKAKYHPKSKEARELNNV